MLAPRPEDRPASFRALVEAAGLARGAAPRAAGRSGWIIGAAAVVAMLVAGSLGLAVFRGGPAAVPSGDALRAQLAGVTAGYDCGSVAYELASDRSVRLSGHVATSGDLTRLRREVAALPGIGALSFEVRLMPRPHCDVAALLSPLAAAGGRDAPALAFASIAGETYIGERPSFDVRAPGFDSYVYIDYFDSGSGQVLHLFPNARDRFNLRPWRNHFVLFKSSLWTICGNVGQQLVVLLALPKPVLRSPRPDVETAEIYIARLRDALKATPPGKSAASLLFFDLRPPPPWVDRELACPSG
jgi:hypothetical protein